eukprot:GHVS01050743.1.p1 GENE.GHVS01050743.1~~GHVS01050743.1.p1  ORF type:complete len:191 (-),score=22.83 GHVS01050743.1:331-903(-)
MFVHDKVLLYQAQQGWCQVWIDGQSHTKDGKETYWIDAVCERAVLNYNVTFGKDGFEDMVDSWKASAERLDAALFGSDESDGARKWRKVFMEKYVEGEGIISRLAIRFRGRPPHIMVTLLNIDDDTKQPQEAQLTIPGDKRDDYIKSFVVTSPGDTSGLKLMLNFYIDETNLVWKDPCLSAGSDSYCLNN